MAIGITGANNGYSRPAADNRFFKLSGGTINGNLTVTGTLSTTMLEALSANITVLDIKQYELSGFNVTGNATVQGSISATGNVTVNQRLNFAGDSSGANNMSFYRVGSNNWNWDTSGVGAVANLNGNVLNFQQDIVASRAGIVIKNIGESTGTRLLGEAPNVLAQRVGASPQESRIYSTYTDSSNYERFFIKTNVGATSATQIGLSAAGTGQNRDLEFVVGGSTRMEISSSGNVGIGASPSAVNRLTVATNDQFNPAFDVFNSAATAFVPIFECNAPNITASQTSYIAIGRNRASKNQFSLGFHYAGNGSNSNRADLNFYGTSPVFSALASGNVGIGTTSPNEKLTVVGNISAAGNATITGHLAASTKSFKIPHQTKSGYLQYGVVESNEHGVYVRGKTSDNTIPLPDHWDWLVHEDSVTTHLTPIGRPMNLYVIEQNNQKVTVGGIEGYYNYTIYGTRKDVPKLQIETEN